MSERKLEVFLATAKCGSFNKAAQKLYIAPQSLIKQIDHLEEEVGVKLFRRTNRGLKLTTAGEEMCVGAEKILQLSEEIRLKCREAARKDDLTVRLGIVPSILYSFLPSLCASYKAGYPDATVLHIPLNDDPYAMILNGTIDLIVTLKENELPNDNLVYYDAVKQQPYVIMLESHRLAEKDVITPEDLEKETIYLPPKIFDYIGPQLNSPCVTFDYSDYSVMNTCLKGGIVVIFSPFYGKPFKSVRLDLPGTYNTYFVGLHTIRPPVRNFIAMASKVYQ